MCLTPQKGKLSGTVGVAHVGMSQGVIFHSLFYGNTAVTYGEPNCLIIPLPAKNLTRHNFRDIGAYPSMMEDFRSALQPVAKNTMRMERAMLSVDDNTETFTVGIYTVILSRQGTAGVQKALDRLDKAEQPQISETLLAKLNKWYPGPIAFACFTNTVPQKGGLFVAYEPVNPAELWFYGFDGHGEMPTPGELVRTDHILGFGHYLLNRTNGYKVSYSDAVGPIAHLLPEYVLPSPHNGREPNGDWVVDVERLSRGILEVKRVLPWGLRDGLNQPFTVDGLPKSPVVR